MARFFEANPGFRSRIAHHIDFPDYGEDELLEIGTAMAARINYRFSADALPALRRYIARRRLQPHFANGRSIRNALDRMRLRQAGRLFGGIGRELTAEDLALIEAEDILPSRVFADEGATLGGSTA
jgi:hypothetical protein